MHAPRAVHACTFFNDNANADAEALASLRSATTSPSCHPDGS